MSKGAADVLSARPAMVEMIVVFIMLMGILETKMSNECEHEKSRQVKTVCE